MLQIFFWSVAFRSENIQHPTIILSVFGSESNISLFFPVIQFFERSNNDSNNRKNDNIDNSYLRLNPSY